MNPKDMTPEELIAFARKQQFIIERLQSFVNNTIESLDTAVEILAGVHDQVASLKEAQKKMDETVTTFLKTNPIDLRETEGGTG